MTISSPPPKTNVPIQTVPATDTYGTARVTNKLGVTNTLTIHRIETGNDVLDYAVGSRYDKGKQFPLTIAKGVYLGIPVRIFRRAYEENGIHTVILADGQELKGKLEFVLSEDSFENPNPKSYDIGSACEVVLISSSKTDIEDNLATKESAATSWQLHITSPIDATYSVSQPKFAYLYWVRGD